MNALELFDQSSQSCSKIITKSYSTSFSLAVRLLKSDIRTDIYNIYGFVRYADEIVDTFYNQDQDGLLYEFENEYFKAKKRGHSMNPIIHSFRLSVKKHDVDEDLIRSFLKSMRMDLEKMNYTKSADLNDYIYGSADAVGLMCLCVFVKGDKLKYEQLKPYAMKLGSAFQKVNFLRDLGSDLNELNRSYFPDIDFTNITEETKNKIIRDIESDFEEAYKGIRKLPINSILGVYTAYRYYFKLLVKLKNTPAEEIVNKRIRISNPRKISILTSSYILTKLNLL